MKKNHWYSVRGQSLAVYARKAGFDLALYDKYSKGIQKELRGRAVKEAIEAIKSASQAQGLELANVKTGVYVIALSNPLSIKYLNKRSQVIYIGRGNILGRVKSHFEHKLFDFMLSLSGADFDFYFAKPARAGTSEYFKHVEHQMLDYFLSEYGGVDATRRFPILNKYAGSRKNYSPDSGWWKKPLKAAGKRPLWELAPTKFGDFAPLD